MNNYEEFEKISGYNSKKKKFRSYVEKYQARCFQTEGGKGLTFNVKPVVGHHANMSTVCNININQGCVNLCSFCKESHVSRRYSEMNIYGESKIVEIEFEGEKVKVPSKIKVKYFDVENNIIVYGAVEVPISKRFPISKSSLRRVISGELKRVLNE